MTPEVIQMIAQFLARTTLKGDEVDAFTTCQKELQEAFTAAVAAAGGGPSVGADDGGGGPAEPVLPE